MKLTVALLLLSSAFAKPDSKAAKYAKAKFSKVKGKAAKSAGYYRRMSMSASMSVGPPPITLTECGESFINEKVVLLEDLDCGSRGEGDPLQSCAVTLDGPQAEINCNDNTLSQEATSQENYNDGPFSRGICLSNGAKARNCNVQQFEAGIDVINGGEVVNSNLSFNNVGIFADFDEDSTSTVTIEDTDASNTGNTGLFIRVDGDGTNAELSVKGENTFNSNDFYGIYTDLASNSNLEINVESGATLKSCKNGSFDIFGSVFAPATATFLGTGYTCDPNKVVFGGTGTVVKKPVCQRCT